MNSGFILLFLLFLIFICIYLYFTNIYNYWSKRGIGGPKPVIYFGTTIYELFKNKSILEINWIQDFGKIYGLYDGNVPVLTVADPEVIKNVLVTDFHNFMERAETQAMDSILDNCIFFAKRCVWKRIRPLTSPLFSPIKLKQMYSKINECVNDLMNELENYETKGLNIDFKEMFSFYTMNVLLSCLFDIKSTAYSLEHNKFISTARTINKLHRSYKIKLLPKFIINYLKMVNKDANFGNEYFFSFGRYLIEQCQSCNKCYFDLIQHYLKSNNNNNSKDKYITENEILAQIWILLMAGIEDPTNILSFVIYELVLNEDIQQKLLIEIKPCFDSKGKLDYNAIERLTYLDAVISETQRLHTSTLRLSRIAANDYKLGKTGLTLKKGQKIEIPLYALHHCEEYFPKPDQFIPERFLPGNVKSIKPYTFLPFSAGPRNCIAMRFASLIMKLCLVQLIMNYKFKKTTKTQIPCKLNNNSFFNQPRCVNAMIEKH